MASFREFLALLEQQAQVSRIKQPVDRRFELAALLQQAEFQNKAIVFNSIKDSAFTVAGGVLTTPDRFAAALGVDHPEHFTREQHVALTEKALSNPIPYKQDSATAAWQDVKQIGADVDCTALPIPTFFEGDSGPFITAGIGISRNPANGILNAGFYRVQLAGKNTVVFSVGPSSDLLGFLKADAASKKTTRIALVIGASPALLMASAAKVPSDISELDVAGAYAGEAVKVVQATQSDLLVPTDAEFVLELEIDHTQAVPNTMGEFGDLYGTQVGHGATVVALSHRRDAIFHVIMAGAGLEHNSIGKIILYGVQPELRAQLSQTHPDVTGVRVHFYPPSMGATGDIYLQLRRDCGINVRDLITHIYGLKCGNYDIARVIRRIVVLDEDVDINNDIAISWAINNRALSTDQYHFFDKLPLPGLGLRTAIDTTVAKEDRERLKRLVIPGADKIDLDDYL